jgi:hypothetical protein
MLRCRSGHPNADPAIPGEWGEAIQDLIERHPELGGLIVGAGRPEIPRCKDLQARDVLGPRKSLAGWL